MIDYMCILHIPLVQETLALDGTGRIKLSSASFATAVHIIAYVDWFFWSWSCADSFPQRPQHIFLAAILVIVKTFTTGILRCMNEEKGLPLTRQKESRSSSPTLGPKANKNNANASTITKAAGNARSNHRYCESGQARQTNRNKLFCIVCIWFTKRYPN